MKYIQKTSTPQFFIDDTKDLDIWNDYYSNKKRNLKQYILDNEQNYLCGYCESKVILDNSHLEHIKPKSLDEENLTFNYNNIIVSCEGKCYTTDNTPESCGHKKLDEFDEELFLNPTTQNDIRAYFTYESNGTINPSGLNDNKSSYTINLLKLNTFNNNLQEARKISLREFRIFVSQKVHDTNMDVKEVVKRILNNENIAFISFLRFQYKHILN
ncbi:MAG: retron system putative HNH endonuclease [Campylobacterota bacterium]|nr:retron system putative HNH endonuclease [Campylobacterota bacterium]